MNGKGHLRVKLFLWLRLISSLVPCPKKLLNYQGGIKQHGLKGADSQIDIAIPCSNLNSDCSFHHEVNLSSIEPPFNRMQMIPGVLEIWDQNLYGSESNIDRFYKGGNMRLAVIPQNRVVEVRDQNLHCSESNSDQIYKGGNRRLMVMPQSRIVRVQDQNVYCS